VKRRWIILLALGLLLAIVTAFQLGRSEREPEFEGKKLSKWAEVWVTSTEITPGHPGVSHDGIDRAIRVMGTNALPWLVDWLDDEPLAPWKTKALKIMAKFPPRLGGKYAQNQLQPYEKQVRFEFAQRAFRTLGWDALPAMPALARLAKNPKSPRGGATAASILSHFGEEAVPELITILRSPRAPGRRTALDYFCPTQPAAVGTNGNEVIEVIIACLNDGDQYVRSHAALALGNLVRRPDIAVPALAKSCNDATADVRESAVIALALFGGASRPARPAIMKALHDTDGGVRAVAAIALEQIPE
jgi:hypothetical protein